ncbi:MAG: SprT family protein [Limosilactobacillus gorillae]|uniref:SprT family protein n=1 Tax=Limosilactobacillus gorillae TaxID=1450649 RepID=UPI000AF91160|nr:SprT family protein [Limosilactobacillus gorillae]MDO4856116.1 SprT family protein [Limosilactobacillus gorillae]
MTNRELQLLVQKWSEEAFKRPFEHSAVFNQRLKTTGGRYHLADHHIDVNPLMYEEYDLATLKKVVLHELCHYHLHLSGRGYRHRDRDFRLLLKQVGGSRYAPPTTKGRRPTGAIIHYRYRCTGCKQIIGRNRRFNVTRFICRQCGHHFEEI